MQVINTNISSLNSQRHLNSTQSSLATTLERLSSGKRINNAKDDAAGLGISDRMTTQINGMNQAIRNARDGISMSQTAEGALSTSSDMLQRIRTLAVQSSNATNASLDRQAIQDEVNELTAELNRIAQTTTFNGQKLLDGTLGTQHYQVGANEGELISASGTNFLTKVYGTYRLQKDGVKAAGTAAKTAADADDADEDADAVTITEAADNGVEASTIDIAGYLGKKIVTVTAGMSALAAANQINNLTDGTGVTAKAETNVGVTFAAAGSYTLELNGNNKDVVGAKSKAVTVSFSVATTDNTADNYAEAVNAINAQSAKTGIMAEYDATINSGAGGIKLTHDTGEDIVIKNGKGSDGAINTHAYKADGTTAAAVIVAKGASKVALGQITYDSSSSFAVQDASALASAASDKLEGSTLHSVASLDLTTFKSAQLAIAICDSAINRIDKEMARYGALQSRFDATIKNLEVNSENTSNARSRIQDADYASETAELSRTTILKQAGTAMLAQANQMPQTVLSLIG